MDMLIRCVKGFVGSLTQRTIDTFFARFSTACIALSILIPRTITLGRPPRTQNRQEIPRHVRQIEIRLKRGTVQYQGGTHYMH